MNLNHQQKRVLLIYSSVYSSIIITLIFIGMCIMTTNIYPTITNIDKTMGEVNEYIHNEKILSIDIKQFIAEGYTLYDEIEKFIVNRTQLVDTEIKNLTSAIRPLIIQTKTILYRTEKTLQDINTFMTTANNSLGEIMPILEFEKNISIEILHKLTTQCVCS